MAFQYFGKSTPIEIGNKTVSTFPSGLCLVQQSYNIRKIDQEIYRNFFISGENLDVISPAIDGLYIFPNPQWNDLNNGFIQISISAYGRVNTNGSTEINAIPQLITYVIRNEFVDLQAVELGIVTYLKIKLVIQHGVFPEINVNDFKDLFSCRNLDGTEISKLGYSTDINFSPVLGRFDVINFGYWDEITYIIGANVSVQQNQL